MNTNPDIFKAYDIRGVYGKDLDEDTAYKLGLAYSQMRKEELKDKDKLEIVVACDMRLSSPSLKESLIKGLIEGGVDVIDIGMSSTPTFYFAVANYHYDGGIIVSASHNPGEYNGFKLVRERALPIGRDTGIMDLKEMVINGDLKSSSEKGELIKKEGVLTDQIEHDLKLCNWNSIEDLKIVIDPANSMGATYFDELFNYLLNCDLVKINWELDGTFPNHEADPLKFENMKDLQKKVLEEKADIGIATDGDGDRIFFVDDQGEIVEPGIIRAILSKIFLAEKPGSKIAYDIRPGRITRDVIEENGGEAIVTPVGHSLIKKIAIDEGAYFAGESSGHFFLNMGDEGCYEVPVIVALKIMEELTKSKQSLSEYIEQYKKYSHSGEINNRVEDPEKVIEEIKNKYSNGEQNELDGITIEYPDFWFNIRKSNTEPLLRLNLEARSKELMEEKKDEILGIITA